MSWFSTGYEDRFEKMLPAQNRLLNGYDTDSIMHYGEAAFSKDGASETMRSKFGHVLRDPSEKHGLDKSDIERINKLYKCWRPDGNSEVKITSSWFENRSKFFNKIG